MAVLAAAAGMRAVTPAARCFSWDVDKNGVAETISSSGKIVWKIEASVESMRLSLHLTNFSSTK